jgi:hypothetical protein
LAALLGTSALLYAQDTRQQEPRQPENQQRQPEDQQKPDEPKAQQTKPSPDQENKKPTKQEKQEKKEQDKQAKANQANRDQKPAASANGGGRGGHIPDDKFRANFGRGHSFKAQTVFVSGQRQFAYGGYNFQLVDAWPAGWAYTDDCYIDFIDGEYFLIDLLHPGMRIAIIVVT